MATNTASSTDGVYAWNQVQGQTASSSGNMYGIYDLSGGLWERTAGYVSNGHDNLKTYGTSLAWDGTNFITASTKYAKVYAHNATIDKTGLEWTEENLNAASKANYEMSENQLVYGNAMHETSTNGIGSISWYNDYSYFPGFGYPFSLCGGYLWAGQAAGLFCFFHNSGFSNYYDGFRPIVVAL